ncbi:hypothetical protein HNQ88_002229 [Aureibacter tunicatorum]|uniref:Uncharacterized protein n=1 Tax=Aureibacter tunicatorum TaxID=866807 RepID=A0AAE3XLN6_9BACT|nr:hypothetical protein [Aureibacter tunicatorum]BDD04882.1 hypothetical protein AUTU_23650 [Aureibacter tunicatorum]
MSQIVNYENLCIYDEILLNMSNLIDELRKNEK